MTTVAGRSQFCESVHEGRRVLRLDGPVHLSLARETGHPPSVDGRRRSTPNAPLGLRPLRDPKAHGTRDFDQDRFEDNFRVNLIRKLYRSG
jgi:hypothetical protein